MTISTLNIRISLLVISSVLFSSCEEFLPPREDPDNIFSCYAMAYQDIHIQLRRNNFTFLYIIKNTYDETVEDNALMTGEMEIEWVVPDERRPDINIRRSVKLNSTNISHAEGYDRTRGILTFDPGDSIVVLFQWNFKTDDSTYLFNYFQAVSDYQCKVYYQANGETGTGYRRVTTRQKFRVKANIKLTSRISTIYFDDIEPEACLVVPYLAEANPPDNPCLQLQGINPCALIGGQ